MARHDGIKVTNVYGLGNDQDALYLRLIGSRERLCLAQMQVPPHWKDELQTALDMIDLVGSATCPQQWSRFDQPEYGTGGAA